MRFINDDQRRAVFSRLNRFSIGNAHILSGEDRSNLVMLPKRIDNRSDAEKLDRNPKWGACLKYDGIRLMSVGNDGKFDLFNPRKGRDDMSVKFPEIVSDVDNLFKEHEPYIIEGEAVSTIHDKSDFHNVVSRVNMEEGKQLNEFISNHPVIYKVFDVLEIDGEDTKKLPYFERRRILSDIIGEGTEFVQLEECVTANKLKHADEYMNSGGEGVIFKNLNSTYQPGKRTNDWLKFKAHEDDTFVVYGFERGSGSNSEAVGSLLIGKFDGDKLISKGKVGSGLSKVDRKNLYERYDMEGLDYLTLPKDRWFGVEVRYMEEDVKGALRQPTIERLREDIGVSDLGGDL